MLMLSKGYTLTDMTKRQVMKAGLLEQLSGVTDVEALRSRVMTALENGGCAFKAKKKGALVGCYVVMRETMDEAALEKTGETAETDATSKVEVLRLTDRVVLPAHDEALNELEHTNDMTVEMKNLLLDGKTKAVLWGDRTARRQKGQAGGASASGGMIGLSLGILFGFALKNIGLGICFGVAFGSLFGMILSGSKGK